MKKFIKWTLTIVITLIVLVIIALVLLTQLVNPNDFKPQIEKALSKATARQVVIEGPIHWQFFPHIGLSIGKTRIQNPVDYDEHTIFAQFNHASAQVSLGPLIRHHFNIETLKLTGFQLNLIEKSPTQNNWQFITRSQKALTTSTASKTSSSVKSTSQPPHPTHADKKTIHLWVKTITIENAQIHFINQLTHQSFTLKNFNFHGENINFKAPFPVAANFSLVGTQPTFTATVNLKAHLQLEPQHALYTFKELTLLAHYHQLRPKQNPLSLNLMLKGQLKANMQQGTANLQSEATVNDIVMSNLYAQAVHVTSTPYFKATLKTNSFDLGKFLKSIGNQVPNLPDPQALSHAQFKLALSGTTHDLEISQLFAEIDQSVLTGHIHLHRDHHATQLTTELNLNQVELSHYVNLNGAQLPIEKSRLTANLVSNTQHSAKANQNLNGTVNIITDKLTLKGLDIGKMMAQFGQALQNFGQQLSKTGLQKIDWGEVQALMPKVPHPIQPDNGQITPFGKLLMHININQGIATFNQSELTGPQLLVQMNGQLDLTKHPMPLNFHFFANGYHNVTTNGQVKRQQNIIGIVMKATGTLSQPKYQLDWPVMHEQLNRYLQAKIQQAVSQAIGNGLEHLFHLK